MEDHKIEIKADSMEGFKKVQEKLNMLPKSVYNQIDGAHWNSLMGCVDCTLSNRVTKNELSIALPSNTSRICNFDTYIGIYMPNFFLRIEESKFLKLKDMKINYYFIDEEDISEARDNKG
jgi:ferredoxin-like protein FixX